MGDRKASVIGWRRVGLAVCLPALLLSAGCEAITKEFRAVAGPAIETGVNSILDGLVDGFFAVFDPDETTAQ